jgi:MFS family permease
LTESWEPERESSPPHETESRPPRMEKHPFAALIMLFGTTLALGLSIGILTPLVAARLDRAGVEPFVNGLTSTAMYLAIGLGALLAGRVIKRVGVRRTFLVGAAGLGLTAAAFPLAPTLTAWFLLRAAAGIFAALFFVSTEVAVGLVGDPAKRARNLAFYGVAFSVGFSTGAGSWPFLEPLGDWGPFLVAAGTSLFAALLGPFLFPDVHPPKRDKPERRKRPRARLAAPLATGFSYGFCESVVTALMPVYGMRIGFSPDSVGWFFVLIIGSGLVAHVPIGLAADRIGPMPLTRGAALIAFAGVVLPLAALGTSTIVVCCILAGIGVGSLYTLGLAEVGRRVDVHNLAAANAKFTSSYGIGSVLGPAAGGLAMMVVGPQGFFWTLAACLALLCVASLLAKAAPPARAPSVLRWHPPVALDLFELEDWP